jgi:hypothetical protein
MLHLITAWKTEARDGDPKVLYCGFDAKKATQIAATAPAKFLRVEKAFVNESYKQRRPQRDVASSSQTPAPARTVAKSEPEPNAGAEANEMIQE